MIAIQDDGQFTYVFDANGNSIYKSNKQNGISYTFEYSALNQLKKATVTSTPLNGNVLKSIEYKYDPAGRRISRQVTDYEDGLKSKTQKFYYDGDNIIAELDESNNLTASYTHSPLRPDDILGAKFTSAAVSNGLAASAGYVYYLKDHLNTVNEITNAVGDIVQKMEYSAFGALRSVKNPTGTEMGFANAPVRSSFTYTGREYEPELGMYYYRARYYDPSVGRFLQIDPHPGKLANPITFVSKYIYAGNSPIFHSDPSGKFIQAVFILAIAVGLIVGGSDVNLAKENGITDPGKLFSSFLNGFFTGFFSTTLTATTGFWGTMGISFLAGSTHSALNQLIFTGKIYDWDAVGAAGVMTGVSAGLGYGAGILSGAPKTWKVVGNPVGSSIGYSIGANTIGSTTSLIYDMTLSPDNSGIPRCTNRVNESCTTYDIGN